MRRTDPAEDDITLGERIVAIKVGFALRDCAHQPHCGLLAERRSGVISRLMLNIGRRNTTSSSPVKNLSWAAEIESD
jgi:hypothetical protein